MSTQNATTSAKPMTIAEVATPEPTKTTPSALWLASDENHDPMAANASFIQVLMRSSCRM